MAKLTYSKTCVKQPLLNSPKIGFQHQLSLNAGQKYCRMLQGEHSAILSTFIKLHLPFRSLFCLFLSGRFTQVLLYTKNERRERLRSNLRSPSPLDSCVCVLKSDFIRARLCIIENYFSYFSTKHMFWVLKRTVSMRRFL